MEMHKFQLLLFALVASVSYVAAQTTDQAAPVPVADGDMKTGSISGSDVVQFTYTVDGTTFPDDPYDIHVTLDVLMGDCDLVVKGPRRFLEFSEHPSGSDVVYVSREKIQAICEDLTECVMRILVVGYSPMAEYELLFDISKEKRTVHPDDQAVLEALWNKCCDQEGACLAWGTTVEASGWPVKENFCHLQDQICDGNGRITHLQLPEQMMMCHLPSEISELKSLQRLSLGHNSISGDFEELLDITKDMKKLKHIHLGNNQIAGELTCCPEGDDKCLHHLKTLDLKYNLISGSLPACLIDLPEIGVLDLRNNYLTGTFPKSLAKNEHMVVLDVREQDGTGMHGELPSFENLENLALLGLSFNSFSGAFPAIPPRLEAVHFSGNFLEGEMHPTVWQLEKIWIFEASDNKLTGVGIPQNLVSMPTLKVLNLANNKFSGTIPDTWETFNLRLLQLNDNSFTGELPGNLATLNRLLVLDVSNNEMSGTFDSFANNLGFNTFRQFQVSNNHFTGSITPEMERLGTFSYYPMVGSSFTQIFDVSYNKLDGEFPDFLLQSLVRLKEGMGEGFMFSVQGNYLACPDSDTGDFIKNQLPDLAPTTCKAADTADIQTIDGSPVPDEVITLMQKEDMEKDDDTEEKTEDSKEEPEDEGDNEEGDRIQQLLPGTDNTRTVNILSAAPQEEAEPSKLPIIIGGAIGGLVVLAVLGVLVAFFVVKPLMRRTRHRQYGKDIDAEAAESPVFQEQHEASADVQPSMSTVEMS